MDGSGRQSQVEEIVINEVGSLLGSNKDKGAGWRHGDQQVVKSLHLLVLIGPHDLDLVSDNIILVSGANLHAA